jgi:hypothetical protein
MRCLPMPDSKTKPIIPSVAYKMPFAFGGAGFIALATVA